MNAAVGLTAGLGLDGDRCIRVIPRHMRPVRFSAIKLMAIHCKVKAVCFKAIDGYIIPHSLRVVVGEQTTLCHN